MHINLPSDISNFFIAGINYKKTDACVRGQFAICGSQYETILAAAPLMGIQGLFILSTCNRTEIYGFAEDADQLIELLCTQTKGSSDTFKSLAYIKSGKNAAGHLFNVAAGLDSQILGDYEIIGQLKQAVKFSKERGGMNCFLERLFNSVLQSSKTIKNDTALSCGTVSVSFAAVQYIRENIAQGSGKKILVIGTGKIGRNTCKNLVDYLGTSNITLINRSEEKAAELATELSLQYAPVAQLKQYIEASDIILVATNACEPVVLRRYLSDKGQKLIIDLSIPYNVEASAKTLENVNLINVDDLSKLKDETLQKRMEEAPKAKLIIEEHLAAFMEWYYMRKNAPALNAIKVKLNEMHMQNGLLVNAPGVCSINADEQIQRVVNGMAYKMRVQNQRGCHYIEAINEFMMAVAV